MDLSGRCRSGTAWCDTGERLDVVRKLDGEWLSGLGTVALWCVAAVVIIPNLKDGGGRAVAVCLGVLLVVSEVLSGVSERWGRGKSLRQGRNLCIAAVLALHHFPEGMAAGFSCVTQGAGNEAVCWAVVLHSIPETMLLISTMEDAGFGRWGGRVAAFVSGLVTVAGVLLGAHM